MEFRHSLGEASKQQEYRKKKYRYSLTNKTINRFPCVEQSFLFVFVFVLVAVFGYFGFDCGFYFMHSTQIDTIGDWPNQRWYV